MPESQLDLFRAQPLLAEKIELTLTSLEIAGELSEHEIDSAWEKLAYVDGAIEWWTGDLWNKHPAKYGKRETYALRHGLKPKTLSNRGWICEKCSHRREDLSFKHHEVVASMPPADQQMWLQRAVDNTWTVKELRVAIRDDKLLNRPPLPDGVYDVIYADPPWQYGPENPQGGPTSLHYPSMDLQELCEMPLPNLAEDAVLFMWVTNPMLKKAFMVVEAWGFDYKTNMVWIKTDLKRPGSGYYVRGRHEFLFIATRGSFTPRNVHASPIGSYFEAPLGEHSEKPKIMYEWIETLYPDCSYIELFARDEREGWEVWGNEVP